MTTTIDFTPEVLRDFKRARNAAFLEGGKDAAFTFEGRTVLVRYADYIIEHIENEFERRAIKKLENGDGDG